MLELVNSNFNIVFGIGDKTLPISFFFFWRIFVLFPYLLLSDLPINSVDKKDCIQALEERLKCNIPVTGDPLPVVVACRRGNDSQIVTQKLKDKFKDLNLDIKDLKGGLLGWTKHVDKNFPIYWIKLIL